jgi:hypothetical protein
MTRTSAEARAPADRIQACVERFAKDVFEASGNDLPDVPFGDLGEAALLLAGNVKEEVPTLLRVVADEFLLRLEICWRGTLNGSRQALALRHAFNQLQTVFPTKH